MIKERMEVEMEKMRIVVVRVKIKVLETEAVEMRDIQKVMVERRAILCHIQ